MKTTFKAGFIAYNMNRIFGLRAIKDMKTLEKGTEKPFFKENSKKYLVFL
jgi:hypothetical protein